MTMRMQDIEWNITEEQIGEMLPELKPEERAEAAENYSQHLRILAGIYNELKDKEISKMCRCTASGRNETKAERSEIIMSQQAFNVYK